MADPTSVYYDALRTICQPVRAADYPPSLRPLRQLLSALGNPEARFPSIVVAGSVGKGTTCHRLAQLLQAGGLKVGLYTSPHLHSFRERFAIDGVPISMDGFVAGVKAIESVSHRLAHESGVVYSTFELATALALWWFAQESVDVAVLECGLGGRWDAVNAVSNRLTLITPIEQEHVAMLGGSLQTIAWHKAGVIQPGGQAITVKQSPVVQAVLENEAQGAGARLIQADNSDLLTVAVETLKDRLTSPLNPDGLDLSGGAVVLPGRMERVPVGERFILIDGGHTPLAARRLFDMAGAASHLIVGMLRDKRAGDFLTVFDHPGIQIILTTAPGHRAADPHTLARQASLQQAKVEVIPDLDTALQQLRVPGEDTILVTGSLRLAAAAREVCGLLTAAELAEAQATRQIFEGADYLAKLD